VNSLVVRGGRVVAGDRLIAADVVVADERVVAVVEPGSVDTTGCEIIDAGGLLVLPGAIDPHVHFDEPGRVEWEGFDCGSAAAAAGGVTTVVDMPIDSDPPTTTASLLRAKAIAASRASRVDVAFWGGLVPGADENLDELVAEGAVGFKAFACPSGWDDFPAVDEPTLITGLRVAARHGLPVALHCELASLGHGVESEVEAIKWAGALAVQERAHLHVVHISSAAGVDEARRWRGVTTETCPHYLTLTDAEAGALGPIALCAPPVRDAMNQAALWDRVLGGAIDCIASDHSPCPPERKHDEDPWMGVSGVETTLAVLLSTGRLSVPCLSKLTTAAASLLRLERKGAIAPGFDADFAIVDPDAEWTVGPQHLWNRHRMSPFIGRTLRGRVLRTIVRGRTVFTLADGPSAPGGGRPLHPKSHSSVYRSVDG
jgi:allantoinase